MPKRPSDELIDLHTHLGGAVDPAIMWTIAHQQGIRLPTKDYWQFVDLITPRRQREIEAGGDFGIMIVEDEATTRDHELAAVDRQPQCADGSHRVHELLALERTGEDAEPIARECRLLESLDGGEVVHAGLERPQQLVRRVIERAHDPLHDRGVLVAAGRARARARRNTELGRNAGCLTPNRRLAADSARAPA